MGLDTSPVALRVFHPRDNHFSPNSMSMSTSTQHPLPVTDLVPEFYLSIPPAGDDLGGLMRMPQGADAHLVVSLDPVVKLGGLPVPYVQLSICISRHHITGRMRIFRDK